MSEYSELSRAVEKPDHIADAVVFDFDMYRDPALLSDPHERIFELTQIAPKVFWTPRNGGHWILQGQSAVFDAARDPEAFSNEAIPHAQIQAMLAMAPKGSRHIPLPYPIMLDPPLHQKYRQPLQRVFSPRTVMGMKEDIRALAATLLDAVATKGRCEFMAAVAEPLPVQIFLKMFGLPLEMMPAYRALVKESLAQHQKNMGPAEGLQQMVKIASIMRDEVLARSNDRRDDIISLLWEIEIDGKPTTIDDIENYAVLLFLAGLDTVMNGIGFATRHLALDQQLQAQLRDNPALIPAAVEEMLRRYTFVVVPRRVNKNISFHGVDMKENERAMLYLPAADLDSEVFSDPQDFQLDRGNNAHIAFNAGPHRCIGSHLARVELQTFYEELLARIPPFRMDPDNPPSYLCSQVIGIENLHLIWDSETVS